MREAARVRTAATSGGQAAVSRDGERRSGTATAAARVTGADPSRAATSAPSGRSPPSPTPRRTSPPTRRSWYGAASWPAPRSGAAARSAEGRGCGRWSANPRIRGKRGRTLARTKGSKAALDTTRTHGAGMSSRRWLAPLVQTLGLPRPSCRHAAPTVPLHRPRPLLRLRHDGPRRPQARTAHDRDRAQPGLLRVGRTAAEPAVATRGVAVTERELLQARLRAVRCFLAGHRWRSVYMEESLGAPNEIICARCGARPKPEKRFPVERT